LNKILEMPGAWLLIYGMFVTYAIFFQKNNNSKVLFFLSVLLLFATTGVVASYIIVYIGIVCVICNWPRKPYVVATVIFLPLIVGKLLSLNLFILNQKTDWLIIFSYLSLSCYSYISSHKNKIYFYDLFNQTAQGFIIFSGPPRVTFSKIKEIDIQKFSVYFLIGFFTKFFIHNQMSVFFIEVTGNQKAISIFESANVILFAKVYIYTSLFGYTTMAFAMMSLLGFKNRISFDKPFHRSQIVDFWQSWQIPIMLWIKKYIAHHFFFRRAIFKNLFIYLLGVFVSVAIWHGLQLKFFVYAILQAVMIFVYIRYIRSSKSYLLKSKSINYFIFQVLFISVPSLIFIFENLTAVYTFLDRVSIQQNTDWYRASYFLLPLLVFTLFSKFSYRLNLRLLKMTKFNFATVFVIVVLFVMVFGSSDVHSFIYSRP
jgi:hypothetical protein